MSSIDLCVFLTTYTLVVAFAATGGLLRTGRLTSLLATLCALTAIVVTTVTGFYIDPGENYITTLYRLICERDFSALASVGLGLGAALVWIPMIDQRTGQQQAAAGRLLYRFFIAAIPVASIVGVVTCSQAFIWKDIRGIKRDRPARVQAPEFVIEKIAEFDHAPIRVAVSESGKIYVSYDYFQEAGVVGGGIIELSQDPATGQYRKRIVADSPLLIRCYGLVARDGQLFVSRSGISASANLGSVEYATSGAVTQLRDLDGDGYFEYAHDIVSGLPGARGPETMQQNNGICFTADGDLLITTASAANRALANHPWEGAVLRARRVGPERDSDNPPGPLDKFSKPEVFAEGFRNPFGIVIGPDDELFVTDNDVDENPGDELNHVISGEHYGHPFVVPDQGDIHPEGFRQPILVGQLEQNFLGLTYASSTSLPEEYRHCLYVAEFLQHSILRITLEKSGDTYRVSSVDKFASVSTPIDIVASESGEFFVVSRNTRNLYRIRPRQASAATTDG